MKKISLTSVEVAKSALDLELISQEGMINGVYKEKEVLIDLKNTRINRNGIITVPIYSEIKFNQGNFTPLYVDYRYLETKNPQLLEEVYNRLKIGLKRRLKKVKTFNPNPISMVRKKNGRNGNG